MHTLMEKNCPFTSTDEEHELIRVHRVRRMSHKVDQPSPSPTSIFAHCMSATHACKAVKVSTAEIKFTTYTTCLSATPNAPDPFTRSPCLSMSY